MKPDAAASAVMNFAVAASDQLDHVMTMSDALLGLARAPRRPLELAPLVRRLDAQRAPAARAGGRALELAGALDELGATSADPSAVRAIVGRCLLDATGASSQVRCEPIAGAAWPTLRIESCDGTPIPYDDEVVGVAADSGIRVQAEASAISISFPR
jgi:hypothetical protein